MRRVALHPLGVLGLATAVAALTGLAVHPRVFALAGGLAAVAVVGVCWPWLTLRGVRVDMRFVRRRAVEGEVVPVAADLTNVLPWPAWGLTLREAAADPGAPPAVRFPTVGGRTRCAVSWPFVPPVRGVYPGAPPRLACGFPFGLFEANAAVPVAIPLVVWPKTFPVGPVPSAAGADVVEGNVTRNKVGSTGDVLGVRPYRRGDSPRRVHWAQSAKHDRLVVCELQSNSRPVVMLVLDADPAAHTPGPAGTLEWAIRVVASFARGWIEAGAQVGLTWGGATIPPASGAIQVTRALDALAKLTPADSKPLVEVLASPAVRSATTAARVVVTTDAPRPPCRQDGMRFVVLRRGGFGGSAGSPPAPAWLDIPNAESVPSRVLGGWSEARHGS
jgi:uncharacterized protein (DUF58 family)